MQFGGISVEVIFSMNLIVALELLRALQGGTGGAVPELQWCLLQAVVTGGSAGWSNI